MEYVCGEVWFVAQLQGWGGAVGNCQGIQKEL